MSDERQGINNLFKIPPSTQDSVDTVTLERLQENSQRKGFSARESEFPKQTRRSKPKKTKVNRLRSQSKTRHEMDQINIRAKVSVINQLYDITRELDCSLGKSFELAVNLLTEEVKSAEQKKK